MGYESFMSIKSNIVVGVSRSNFALNVNQAITLSRLDLRMLSLKYSEDQESWEWIGYVFPNLNDWVSIWQDKESWHVSAITTRCGVLKLVHSNLKMALTELKLVSQAQKR